MFFVCVCSCVSLYECLCLFMCVCVFGCLRVLAFMFAGLFVLSRD